MIDQRYRDLVGAAEEAASPPEFASVRRRAGRLRAQRRAGGALVAAALVASGTAGVVTLRPSGDGWEAAAGGMHVSAVGAADAEHLYAIVSDCADCVPDLLASGDGGRTWQDRALPEPTVGTPGLIVLGPEILVDDRILGLSDIASGVPEATSSPGEVSHRPGRAISLDGGRTWAEAGLSDTPVAAVPPGTRAIDCRTVGAIHAGFGNCPLYAVDPASGRFAPLAEQPPVDFGEVLDVPVGAGIWVVGTDPATEHVALAVSRDGGRTWRPSVFDDEAPMVEREADTYTVKAGRVGVATTGGDLAYVTFVGDESVGVYRTADGGKSWAKTYHDRSMAAPLSGPGGIVTTDGTHVLTAGNGSGFQYLGSADGRSYTRTDLGGLPALGHSARAITDRFFLFQGKDAVYTSADGRSWRRVLD